MTVEASDDGNMWVRIGDGTISHYAEGGAQTSVCVDDGGPIRARHRAQRRRRAAARSAAGAARQAHTIVFEDGGTRRLLSGNAQAHAPTYDLGARLAHEDWRADDAATPVTSVAVSDDEGRPLGNRSALFTGALLAAALVLGLVALRSIPAGDA